MAHEKYQHLIALVDECAMMCNHCAIECMQEEDVRDLQRCIRLNLDCAEVCTTAANLMSRGSEFAERFNERCAEICNSCAAECESHKHMEHCRECAEICRKCAEACMEMAA
jgi:hypothetical protein